jgi:hypothetical protein
MAKLKYLGMTDTHQSTLRAEQFGKCLLLLDLESFVFLSALET